MCVISSRTPESPTLTVEILNGRILDNQFKRISAFAEIVYAREASLTRRSWWPAQSCRVEATRLAILPYYYYHPSPSIVFLGH